MKSKLFLGFSSIIALLIISCLISVLEYRKMDSYVSDLISKDIDCINQLMHLTDLTQRYNHDILMVIGVDELKRQPYFDTEAFFESCDFLEKSIGSKELSSQIDFLRSSFSEFYEVSLELPEVIKSPFIDSRSWFFERLQPYYFDLGTDISALEQAVHEDLSRNSTDFDNGFYRSIMPGIVAIGMSIILVFLLLFFIVSDYVTPVYSMLKALEGYNSLGRRYGCKLEGDDQMNALNDGISALVDENIQMKHRIIKLKHDSERKNSQ